MNCPECGVEVKTERKNILSIIRQQSFSCPGCSTALKVGYPRSIDYLSVVAGLGIAAIAIYKEETGAWTGHSTLVFFAVTIGVFSILGMLLNRYYIRLEKAYSPENIEFLKKNRFTARFTAAIVPIASIIFFAWMLTTIKPVAALEAEQSRFDRAAIVNRLEQMTDPEKLFSATQSALELAISTGDCLGGLIDVFFFVFMCLFGANLSSVCSKFFCAEHLEGAFQSYKTVAFFNIILAVIMVSSLYLLTPESRFQTDGLTQSLSELSETTDPGLLRESALTAIDRRADFQRTFSSYYAIIGRIMIAVVLVNAFALIKLAF